MASKPDVQKPPLPATKPALPPKPSVDPLLSSSPSSSSPAGLSAKSPPLPKSKPVAQVTTVEKLDESKHDASSSQQGSSQVMPKSTRPLSGSQKPLSISSPPVPAPYSMRNKKPLSMIADGNEEEEEEKETEDRNTTTRDSLRSIAPPNRPPPPQSRPMSGFKPSPTPRYPTSQRAVSRIINETIEEEEQSIQKRNSLSKFVTDSLTMAKNKIKQQFRRTNSNEGSFDSASPSRTSAFFDEMPSRALERHMSLRKSELKLNEREIFFGDGLFDLVDNPDKEFADFNRNVREIRKEFEYTHPSNKGYLNSLRISQIPKQNLQGNIIVYVDEFQANSEPIALNISLNLSVEELIRLCLKALLDRGVKVIDDASQFLVKFAGKAEYLCDGNGSVKNISIASFKDISWFFLFNKPIALSLTKRSSIRTPFQRLLEDDLSEGNPEKRPVKLCNGFPMSVSRQGLNILLDTFKKETNRFLEAKDNNSYRQLTQSVKAIVFTLAIEIIDIKDALDQLEAFSKSQTGDVAILIKNLREAIIKTIELYELAINQPLLRDEDRICKSNSNKRCVGLSSLEGTFKLRVRSLHRLPTDWLGKHAEYVLRVGLFYGGQLLASVIEIKGQNSSKSWCPSIVWSMEWLDTKIQLNQIPRETRICFELLASTEEAKNLTWMHVAWVNFRLFDFRGKMESGMRILGLWVEDTPKSTGTCALNPSEKSPALLIELPSLDYDVFYFTEEESSKGHEDTKASADEERLTSDSPQTIQQMPEKTFVTGPKYMAKFTYTAVCMDELGLIKGQTIEILNAPDGGWWQGRCHETGQEGWFPQSFLEATPLPPEATIPLIDIDEDLDRASSSSSDDDDEGNTQNMLLKPNNAIANIVRARAVYLFEPQSFEELGLEVDDIVDVIQQPEGGWWEGSLNGKTGWFPASFVEIIQNPVPRPRAQSIASTRSGTGDKSQNLNSSSGEPKTCIVEHAYNAQFEDELTLLPGTEVTLLEVPKEGGWWQGRFNGKEGWFPCNHVKLRVPKMIRPKSALSRVGFDKTLAANSNYEVYVATHVYVAKNTDELNLRPGDKVRILQKPDGGWWEGELNDVTGWFPSNHVRESIKPPSKTSGEARIKTINTDPLSEKLMKDAEELVLKDACDLLSNSDRLFLWTVRTHLMKNPVALPKVLASAPPLRTPEVTREMQQMVEKWVPPSHIEALELLHSHFADIKIRADAVGWIFQLPDDDLFGLLPQLVQALKYESFHNSALATGLLKRAMTNARICHSLFWLLRSDFDSPEYGQRFEIIIETLLNTCGSQLRQEFAWQSEIVKILNEVNEKVLACAISERKSVLRSNLKDISTILPKRFRLPLDPSFECSGIEIESCNVFNSNSVPLRICFTNSDDRGSPFEIIFKIGDDLRQDAIVIQLIRLMDQLWRSENLDLKIVTFLCVPTNRNSGLIEMIPNASTLRQIQTKFSVTGSFNDRMIYEWLKEQNPTPDKWAQAHSNFMLSCAGYCVATYILGVCDRHNDNIMITKDGHLFHIDFGRFLGNAQKFGSINRDRVPFVLTSDMAYVINDGEKPTSNFQQFTDICCKAFNIIRTHYRLFINLLGLMLHSGIPELQTLDDIKFVREKLHPDLTDEDATSYFTRLIQQSLSSKSTKINFFIHNLAQLKSSVSSGNKETTGSLLTFCPEDSSLKNDGRIKHVEIIGFDKRFDHVENKFYVYILEVQRVDDSKILIFRRFSEFNELHLKLTSNFPQLELPVFPSKIYVGRSHIRQVSERRQVLLAKYIEELLKMPEIISESDLLYTFLHSNPRDIRIQHERDDEKQPRGKKEVGVSAGGVRGPVTGEILLSIKYDGAKRTLTVLVKHVKNLTALSPEGTANPYVKIYLLPNRSKSGKRKTTVKQDTLNPTFHESLQFSVDPSEIKGRVLQVMVWDRDRFGENSIMGGVLIPFQEEDASLGSESWYALKDIDVEKAI